MTLPLTFSAPHFVAVAHSFTIYVYTLISTGEEEEEEEEEEQTATLSSAMETRLSTPFSVPKLPSLKRKRPPQIEIPNILQEIQSDDLRFRDSAHQNDAVCSGGNGFGVVSRKGKKKFMEDSHRVAPCSVGSSDTVMFSFTLNLLVGDVWVDGFWWAELLWSL